MKLFFKAMSFALAASAILLFAASCDKNTAETDTSADTGFETASSPNAENKFGDYTIEQNGTGVTLIAYSGAQTDIVIPETAGDAKVTKLGDNLFRNRYAVKSVSIPDTVTEIGEGAFSGCSVLETLNIPDSVSAVGASAFADTPWFDSLTDEFVTVGDGVVIKYNGTDTDVTIPEGVKYISNLFRYSEVDVTSVTLPEGALCIGTRAFAGLKALTTVNFSSTVTAISNNAFTLCVGITEMTIPESVTSIDEYAFSHCKNLKTMIIKGQIKTLETATFFDCDSLNSIELPASLETLKADSLASCPALRTLVFTGDLNDINMSAFDSNPGFIVKCPDNSNIESFCIANNIAVNPGE